MDRLIDELTFYSKIDTNKIPYTFSKINVSQYFRDCVEEVGLDMEARGIELGYFNYVDEDVVVIADAEQMKRVINNIISNSVKYLDKKKVLSISASRMTGISSRWRSRTMEKELQPKICQISLTGSTAPTLPEILPRAEAVSVCPLCERSLRITVAVSGLPVKRNRNRGALCFKKISGGCAGMSKILIVEDEESIAELEKDYLELSGFEVEIENNGTDGLERALKEEYDLLILDLMLPGTDGFEICRRVREVKNTPIIMVSAKKEDIDKIRGLGLGADDYITKPFSPSEMVARVKAHMARYERLVGSGQPANEIIEIRGLKIDKTARRVWVNGEEKTFTTKEFDLLSFLAQNPNHVFTKEELFSKIWDMESIGDIATVTVHIKKIREKIEFNTAKPQYIETIWGVGYRFKI